MSGFRRFFTGVFALVGLFATAACALTIFGPWRDQAMVLFAISEYAQAVEACLLVLAVGLLAMLLRAIFSRQVKVVEVGTVDGGTISVTRDAIAAQATHIVEKDGTCSASKVRVKAKKRGNVRVYVRVLPHSTVDVVTKGEQLHAELAEGLRAVCGDKVRDVSLEFVEPEAVTTAIVAPDATASGEVSVPVAPAPTPAAYEPEGHEPEDSGSEDYAPEGYEPGEAPTEVLGVPAGEPEDVRSSEITVPMGGTQRMAVPVDDVSDADAATPDGEEA